MVCASCFDEYKQLKDDVEVSERTLDARRKTYDEQMKKKKAEMEEYGVNFLLGNLKKEES